MSNLPLSVARARTIGRLALVAATVLSAACGTAPTAPSAPMTARTAVPAGPMFSGYMLSSGRESEVDTDDDSFGDSYEGSY